MANNNSNLIEKLLGGSGLNQVWVKVFSLVKILTGDVDVKNKGNLQKQIDDVRSDVGGIMDGTGDTGLVFADDTESEYDTAIGQVVSGKPLSVLFQYLKAALKSAYTLAQKAYNVAAGKNQARVFATVGALDEWLGDPDNLAQLHVGDNFYIVALDVPDYWWDGEQKQPLETQKVDMTTYDQAIAALQSADTKLNGDIMNLSQQIQSFENAKGDIVGSTLGGYLGLSTANKWDDIINSIKNVILSGNAEEGKVLVGQTFYTSSLEKKTGSMLNAPDTSQITLTSADGRKILAAREVWVVQNSDGVRRVCLECPLTGYYTNISVIAAPANDFSFNIARTEYRSVVFNKSDYTLGTTMEYYGTDFYVNDWPYYLANGAIFIASIDVDSSYWADSSQIAVTAAEISEDHRADGGYIRVRVGVRCTERESKVSCIIFARLIAICPYL